MEGIYYVLVHLDFDRNLSIVHTLSYKLLQRFESSAAYRDSSKIQESESTKITCTGIGTKGLVTKLSLYLLCTNYRKFLRSKQARKPCLM